MKKGIAWLLTVLLILGACAPALADTYAGDYVYADTRLDSVSDAGRHNIELAVAAINGLALEPGRLFSFNDTVGPRTRAEGYRGALNGRGVEPIRIGRSLAEFEAIQAAPAAAGTVQA